MVNEKSPFGSMAEDIRRKWKERKVEPKQPKAPVKDVESDSLVGSKACPACNVEYFDTNLVVCPKDRTMLLTRRKPTFSWFECAKNSERAMKRCPQCSEIFLARYENCKFDNTELEPYDYRSMEVPVLEDRFRLSEYMGTDGLFQTFSAVDLADNKKVSVRFLTELSIPDPKTVSRILDLGRKAIGLSHPSLLSTYAVNVTTDAPDAGFDGGYGAVPYLVSDYTISKTLKAEISARQFLDPATAAEVFIDILAALSYAHGNGIVHGAISTDNLRVGIGENGKSSGLLANFGLAERLFRELDWDAPSTNTHTASVYGDPDGICPEFCKGQRPTPQSDLYQIGCSLYEALCGRPPFERPAVTQVLLAHMMDEPDDIRTKNRNIPDQLVPVVLKCLKKNPEDRYQSAQALSDDLQQFKKR